MTALELKRIIDMPGFLAWPGCHLTCRYTLRRLSRLPLQLLSFVGPGSQLKAWPPCKNARKHPRNFGTIDQLMCYIVAKILCPLGNRGPHTHTHPHTPTHTHTRTHQAAGGLCFCIWKWLDIHRHITTRSGTCLSISPSVYLSV